MLTISFSLALVCPEWNILKQPNKPQVSPFKGLQISLQSNQICILNRIQVKLLSGFVLIHKTAFTQTREKYMHLLYIEVTQLSPNDPERPPSDPR